MVDGAVDHHLAQRMSGFCEKVAQLTHEVEADVWIIDADRAGEHVVHIVTVEVDVLIGITFVVEVADEPLSLDVGALLAVQLSLDGESGSKAAEVALVEQLPKVEFIGLQLAVEMLLTVHRALNINVAGTGEDRTV